jgi:hypothetical protein
VIRSFIRLSVALVLIVGLVPVAAAQDQKPDDEALKVGEPDFTLIGLPTSLRLPKFKSAFRVSHRFRRPLGAGDFGDLAADLFGIDSGAGIGLEYRFGILPGGQIGVHRTGDSKTVEFFAQYGVFRQDRPLPIDVSVLFTIEGTNNFQENYSPAVGVILSRTFGTRASLYVEPIWVNNTNQLPKELVDHNSTFIVGIGGRLRVTPSVYVVAEVVPRTTGYKPGVPHGSFAVEKRWGGHSFQLNFSNSYGSTLAQLARGGFNNDDWYMGFNISRKFF